MSFGVTSGGWQQYEAYRPSIEEFSSEVTRAREAKLNPSARVPLPKQWDFDIRRSNLLLEPSASDYLRYVKAFGFIAHLHECSSDDTPSAFTASVVLKLPFRFGSSQYEEKASWAFVRINAFSAKASPFSQIDFYLALKSLLGLPFLLFLFGAKIFASIQLSPRWQ